MRHAARRDGNDALITNALRKAGFLVHDYAKAGVGIPDKLIVKDDPSGIPWVCWVEIKTPKGKLRPSQIEFQSVFLARNEYYVARDPEEAVREMMDRYLASIKQEYWR
jgi:hypothetical protein